MQNQPNWNPFFVMLGIAICLFYQSYINIKQKKFTGFSLDSVILFIIIKFGGKKYSSLAKSLSKRPERVQLMGKYAFYIAIGFVYGTIDWYVRHIDPFLD